MVKNTKELNIAIKEKVVERQLTYQCGSDGTFNSNIAVVAEAPGEREVSMQMPLVGGSGKLLWDCLRKYKINRLDTYITNVAKRQVAFPNQNRKPMSTNEFEAWKFILLWELEQLPNLQYVLCLGNYALRVLTSETKITDWRGSVLDATLPSGKKLKVIATFNPAAVIREPKNELVFRFDLDKLEKVRNGKFKEHKINAHINPSADEAIDWIRSIHNNGIKGVPVSLDIETMAGETACIGLATDIHEGYCINFRERESNRYSLQEEKIINRRMQVLLGDKRVKFVAQNGNFDSYWLWYKDRLRIHSIWFDTLLAHHTLYPSLPHSLAFLTSQYTTHPFYKDEGKDWKEGGNINQFWEYNVKDVCITRAAQIKLLDELRNAELDKFYFDHVMRANPELVRMTVTGIPVDGKLKEHITEITKEDVADSLHEFHKLAQEVAEEDSSYTPNPNSPKQMADLFFRKAKLIGRGTKTDEENRKRMLKHPRTKPIAKEMLLSLDKYKKDHKFLTTYAEMKIDEDTRVRCEYKQYGVQSAPGRLSSSKVMWGSGMNMQNQPDRAKTIFIAPKGYGFVYFDLEQAEARVVGWKAKIDKWIEQFERARLNPGTFDCHRALASEMWKIPYDETPTKDRTSDGTPTKRFVAKRCRHGLNYRMQADRLATVTGLPIREADTAFRIYHEITPELKRWWEETEREVYRNRVLYNAFGRRFIILERLTPESMESIVAFYPQSTIGDKVTQVIYQCHSDDNWPRECAICLNVHDALVAFGPLDKLKTCGAIMRKYAEQPLYIDGRELIIPAEMKISYPTVWDEENRRTVEDPNGVHRWSDLRTVQIDAAA